ncbi:MAG: response regulator transcription factor [Lachnospiraceae bacterium]|nr:response regulator transcription factor [Lachnospiraceae bacterium]MBQ6196843.1 response regulator transcription factor [Lachnospiraceae bacterium]
MGKEKVMIVDDEERIRSLMRDFLVREGIQTVEASDGEEALTLFFEHKDLDVIILDVMMPKLNGWQVLEEIRRYSQVPVIMLTALSEEQDELKGFRLGVDEYVTKPFSPRVLVARVKSILKKKEETAADILEAPGLTLNKISREVYADGIKVELSLKEFELLTYFMENPGTALSREAILNHVWNYNYYGDARTIDTHVKTLRSKIGAKGECIKTVWGVGYKFEA